MWQISFQAQHVYKYNYKMKQGICKPLNLPAIIEKVHRRVLAEQSYL